MSEFFAEHWIWLGPALLACGGILVKATPTKKDDEWWQRAKDVWNAVFGRKPV